jgi:hypothetical protein
MKAVIERKLSDKDTQDRDKVAAKKRIERRLKDLLRRHPELDLVQKSRLGSGPERIVATTPRQSSDGASFDDEASRSR